MCGGHKLNWYAPGLCERCQTMDKHDDKVLANVARMEQQAATIATIPSLKPPVRMLQEAARKAETMFRNFAGEDPGACLTAGSEHAEACEIADELRDANAAIDNWREFLNNCARPGDVANVILERDTLRTQRDELLTCLETVLSELVLADPTCSGGHRFAAIKEAQRLIAKARP